MLGAQALLMMITLEIERPVGFGGCCAGNYIPVWRQIVGCGFRLGPVWETLGRNFALLWVALSATCLNRKAGTSDVFPDHVPALCRMAPLLAILPNGLPS